MTPFQAFATADGWIVVGGMRDWEGFCAVLGRMDLAEDTRFADNEARTAHRENLEPALQSAFRQRPTAEWLSLLEGVCLAAPVLGIDQVLHDPHLQARKAVMRLPVPGLESRFVAAPRSPVRLSRTPSSTPSPAPTLGQHTAEVLQGLLGLKAEEISNLERARVIKTREHIS